MADTNDEIVVSIEKQFDFDKLTKKTEIEVTQKHDELKEMGREVMDLTVLQVHQDG